ncbi:glycerophosphodiester phosphodiesterase [Prosthecomicrobium hirschii]|uniref:Glycerophosphodiester phosphodiesterase n=1 Tax=Prosthecodimorpha hirschii TaxID=665126 RepID=A0A0P6W9M1_9HYPH|nr:glycerophosphodiester phosphodiesterase family protein [Prosthecomicrobium hirschii]KPL51069.1 glycerophosphodiester phosphodiesterase [Prosthecomicrobium hirschii]TPQ52094.1 glycerophosphodiester phosphodiesterase [Prosthecomicrobium hirschii]
MDLGFLVRRPVAHRGYHDIKAGRVENTLTAVRAAVARDFAIEVDVQLTGDGEAVVFHDFTLDRLTTGQGRLDRKTLAEIQGAPFRVSDDRVPTLAELLDTVAGRVGLIIEIKSDFARPADLRLVRRTVAGLKGYRGPVAVKSFDPDMVAEVGRLAPDLPRGIVADDARDPDHYGRLGAAARFSLRHLLHMPRTKPHFISYGVKYLPAPGPAFARKVMGKPVITWTVRTEADRAVASAYADQIVFEGFDPDAKPH